MKYTGGIERKTRRLLRSAARESPIFSTGEVAERLGVDRAVASRLLSQWYRQGWVQRLRRGLYALIPVEADAAKTSFDPWIAAYRSFQPCYIAGWSACEHWQFTEQIFRTVCIFTARRVKNREGKIASTPYLAKHIPKRRMVGLEKVWRGQLFVEVSDPHKTIADVLDDPAIGGGVRHVAQVVAAYFRSDRRHDENLLEYCKRIGNRTAFKRLGFLVESQGIQAPSVIAYCLANLSAGYSRLDPAVRARGRILRRWRLFVNVEVGGRS